MICLADDVVGVYVWGGVRVCVAGYCVCVEVEFAGAADGVFLGEDGGEVFIGDEVGEVTSEDREGNMILRYNAEVETSGNGVIAEVGEDLEVEKMASLYGECTLDLRNLRVYPVCLADEEGIAEAVFDTRCMDIVPGACFDVAGGVIVTDRVLEVCC